VTESIMIESPNQLDIKYVTTLHDKEPDPMNTWRTVIVIDDMHSGMEGRGETMKQSLTMAYNKVNQYLIDLLDIED